MKLENVQDAVLVRQYLEGNEKGIEVLIIRHKQRIYNFIFSKVLDRDISEDIFQDTFIKVIRTLKKGKYNEEGKFLPWVMRIAHNLVIDHFRRNKRMPKFQSRNDFDIFDVISDGEESMEYEMITFQMHEDVRRLIEELPEDQKEVLVMRIFKEMSFKEIAAATHVSINTALGRMRYALINLRKVIDKNQIILTR
ncbi:sigma-70 family RNA polymerase sigma factor [Nonlabens sp.]|uniref:sigma-70 family RNA polymerase sigma factor n=1 Tax=Nonlabens sp. TaxID=1888209 RepID=UPI001BCEBC09|nr:sigma-70 family RNA polymerase sigma factor [Nonlabens sp.]